MQLGRGKISFQHQTLLSFFEEVFTSHISLAKSHAQHRNSHSHNKEMANLNSSLDPQCHHVFLAHMSSLMGVPWLTQGSLLMVLCWVGCWNLCFPGRNLKPWQNGEKRRKKETLGVFFVFYVMTILSLMEQNELTSWFIQHNYPWVMLCCLTTDCVMHSTHYFTHCYFKAVPGIFRPTHLLCQSWSIRCIISNRLMHAFNNLLFLFIQWFSSQVVLASRIELTLFYVDEILRCAL